MIKAGALLFSLGFLVLISATLYSLILYDQYSWKDYHVIKIRNELVSEVNGAIADYPFGSSLPFDSIIIERDFIKVSIYRVPFGMLDLLVFRSVHGRVQVEKILVENFLDQYDHVLNVSGSRNNIKLTGKSMISGNVFLSGRSFDLSENLSPGTSAFKGEYLKLEPCMKAPAIVFPGTNQKVNMATDVAGLNALSPYPAMLKSDYSVILSDTFKGVSLIVAPSVIIKSGFSGIVHIYATDSIIVEDSVNLEFPSVLYLINRKKCDSQFRSEIVISSMSRMNGFIYNDCTPGFSSHLLVDSGSFINGIINYRGTFDLRGVVHGIVKTDKFVFSDDEFYREDQIHNGKIFELDSLFYIHPFLISFPGINSTLIPIL